MHVWHRQQEQPRAAAVAAVAAADATEVAAAAVHHSATGGDVVRGTVYDIACVAAKSVAACCVCRAHALRCSRATSVLLSDSPLLNRAPSHSRQVASAVLFLCHSIILRAEAALSSISAWSGTRAVFVCSPE